MSLKHRILVIPAIASLFWTAPARPEAAPVLQLDTGGHQAVIRGLLFTSDGKFLVSAGDDKVVRIWDWRAGKTVRTIRGQSRPGHEGKIFTIALSPDGRWLAVGGWMKIPGEAGHVIRLYDFANGKLSALLKGHLDIVYSLAFSLDSKRLISGSADKVAIIWDVEDKTVLHRLLGHRDFVVAAKFTADGTRVITGSFDKTIRLWRVTDGLLLKEMVGHREKIYSLAISPRNGSIASGDWGGEVLLWEANSGAFRSILASIGDNIGSLRFAPGGGNRLLATCGGSGCGFGQGIYDADSGKRIIGYTKHHSPVLTSDFSPDGSLAATGAGGKSPEIHVWDAKTGETKAVLSGTGLPSFAVGFSPDGRTVAWGTEDSCPGSESCPDTLSKLQYQIRLPEDGKVPFEPSPVDPGKPWSRAIASFGSLSLQHRKGGNFGYDAILDILKDGTPTGISIERTASGGYRHRTYSFSADGAIVISGASNGTLTAFGLDGRKIGEFIGHEGDVWAVAPSPDGRYLVSGSADQTVRLWDIKTRELLVTLFRGRDGEWVMWTPEGFYTGSEGAEKIVGLADQSRPGQGSPLYHGRSIPQSLIPARSRRGQDRRRSTRAGERGGRQAQFQCALEKCSRAGSDDPVAH